VDAVRQSAVEHWDLPADFFAAEVERLYAVPDGDVRLALGRAWEGFGVITAGAEMLARSGYPWHAGLVHDMTPVLSAASEVLRAAATFPGDAEQVAVTVKVPGGDTDPALVYMVQRGVYEVALALTSLLRKTSQHAAKSADRQACRRALLLARTLAAAYEISPKWHQPDAIPHSVYLAAGDEAELRQLVSHHADALRAGEPTDTRATLTAAWYAVSVAECLARFAASRDPEAASRYMLWSQKGIASVAGALASAPSLPADIHGVGLDTHAPDETPRELVALAAEGVVPLMSATALSLERAARLARDPKDRSAAERASRNARDLASLYARHGT
jgi:hypothetical protein